MASLRFLNHLATFVVMEQGLVIKSTGSRYRVMYGDGKIIECTIKGKFRVRGSRTTNPVAVGDRVTFVIDPADRSGVISELHERKNYIIRKASNLSKESQIIAANIDQVFLMVTIKLPETPVEFIDRFLVTSEAYRIKTSLIFNKTDLYNDEENEKMRLLTTVYSDIGYRCFSISLTEKTNTGSLEEAMKDRISLLSGNSGVGKTTLLNILNPELNLKTGEISDYHRQGKHITTFPEMHPLPFGGFLIDTPGIRGFGMIDMNRSEIYHFFPEIFKKSKDCRFNNCLHLEEPDCAVRNAVEKGEIYWNRYRSYLNILEDENRKYR
jgi:ribosome biogenesis GTPase / thiamine phosphate phosphatase